METVLTIQYQESSDRGRPWHLYVQGLITHITESHD